MSDSILKDLKATVTKNAWITDINQMQAYTTEWRDILQGIPLIVLLPDSVEQVSHIVKLCALNKIEIIPQGTVTLLLRRFMDSPPHGCTLVESDSAGLRVSTLNEEARAGLLAWLAEQEVPLRSLAQVELSLEDAFGRLVGKASDDGVES